jgi:hypothetical protein
MKALGHLTKWLRNLAIKRLEATRKVYEQRTYNNMDKLLGVIQKGDVVLVEGRSDISRFIKLFTNSSWSHSALYIGDELIERDSLSKEKYQMEFGADAGHLLIEAEVGKGVTIAPLRKYQDHNIRICRPYGILPRDLESVIQTTISNLGKHYDSQNIIDIGLMLLPFRLNPFKKHTINACLGSCNQFRVICSGMIAKSFQSVSYPIVPVLQKLQPAKPASEDNPYGSRLIMRHYSQILPRDFDISPNFEVIKFNIIGDRSFDYRSLWADGGSEENRRAA